MQILKNVYLVGTSHVSKESIKRIKKALEINPDIIAVELDENRATTLEENILKKSYNKEHNNKKSIKKEFALIKEIGFLGYLFLKIGESLQNKYGDILNVNPGLDMYEAIKISKEKNLMLFFIDRNIKTTLLRFSTKIKKREILKIIFEIIFSPFIILFNKNKKIDFDISKIPDEKLIDLILTETKKNYPSIYKVLIDERDLYMAKKLFILSQKYPDKKILAITGAGHIKGIINYLKKLSENHADIAY